MQIKSHTTNRAALLSFFLVTPQSLSLSIPLPLCAGGNALESWRTLLSILSSFKAFDNFVFWELLFCAEKMASCKQWTVFLSLLCLVSATMAAPPKKPVAVPFGRNYMPTWAFDHIKYFNGGKEIQLHLDKYTGTKRNNSNQYIFMLLVSLKR